MTSTLRIQRLLVLVFFRLATTMNAFNVISTNLSTRWPAYNDDNRGNARLGQRLSSHSVIFPSDRKEATIKTTLKPGTAKLPVPWQDLGFQFRPTRSHIRITYKNDAWGLAELVQDPFINLHVGATALHYGQSCLEGLKAFHQRDGSVYLFRPDESAFRMQSSCRRTMMPELPTETFVEACKAVVFDNLDYVPPYGSGGALYLRPLLFGSGPRIGVQPADEYTFLILVVPVGDYYKGGLGQPVDGLIIEDYDRAAPRGMGHVKVAGNYAADLLPNMLSKKKGFPIGLYLDAATQTTIEEFNTSNFAGIDVTRQAYVTPKSLSALPSITNKSLMQIATEVGLTVEQRTVNVQELEHFDEVLAVGTAVVVTPVGSLTRYTPSSDSDTSGMLSETRYEFGTKGQIGPLTQRLYNRMRAIQNGEAPDMHGWNVKVV